MTEIRQIKPNEWPMLKQVRLAALSDSPGAFLKTVEEERRTPDSTWQRRAGGTDSFSAVAMDGAEPVGMAVGIPDPEDSLRAYLVSMWVAPAYRGTDTASSLLHLVERWAAGQGAETLFIGVKPSNARAEAFYRNRGFETHPGAPPDHPAVSGCDPVLRKQLEKGSEPDNET